MSERVLITGGAGFIGSHIADAYLASGYRVRVLDKLESQVHGNLAERGQAPDYLSKDVEFVQGDICDRDLVKKCLEGVDILSHHAANVGVGQSMYEIARYTRNNAYGAAVVLDVIANEKHTVRKMLVASSMSIYGEGAYVRPSTGEPVFPTGRETANLDAHRWELTAPDGEVLQPRPTPESKPLYPFSVYAINKRDHEEMFQAVGSAYKIPTVAFRYFNVYGTRQALSNPYTGVIAIFCSRLLNRQKMVIYEDGLQQRDFVSVKDLAAVNLLATQKAAADFRTLNIGAGSPVTIRQIAETVAGAMGHEVETEILGKYRSGDIRHCYPDTTLAQRLLSWKPVSNLRADMPGLIEWVQRQTAHDYVAGMKADLERRNLLR